MGDTFVKLQKWQIPDQQLVPKNVGLTTNHTPTNPTETLCKARVNQAIKKDFKPIGRDQKQARLAIVPCRS